MMCVIIQNTALGLGMLFGMDSQTLAEFVLLMALPTAFIGVILAGRYQTYESPAAATLVVTAIAFAATAPLWLLLVNAVSG